MCVCLCVLSCSRFDFEGLESGDDGAFDKLRSWSRSIEDLQPPSALSAPFTNSLARSARQSVLRYVHSICRLPLTPAPRPARVTAVSAHATPSALASRLSSLTLCLPVCLWSVLSVSLTLPSNLFWVSTWPLAVPTPSGVPALPSSRPLSGVPFVPHSHSAIPPGLWGRLALTQVLWSSLGDPAPALMSVSLWLCILSHQLLRHQLPASVPPAHLLFTSSFRPFLSKAAMCSFVCTILKTVLPRGRWMDQMTSQSHSYSQKLF